MFGYAPLTRIIDWLTTTDFARVARKDTRSDIGTAAIEIARSEIGNGEFGGNNRGPDLERYRAGYGRTGAWCAAFVVFCIEQASAKLHRPSPVERTHGARKLFGRIVKAGRLVDDAEVLPGDIVLWARGAQGSWTAHIGIVTRVNHRDGKVTSWDYIAGNEGAYPAVVRERRGDKKRRRIGFARLD